MIAPIFFKKSYQNSKHELSNLTLATRAPEPFAMHLFNK